MRLQLQAALILSTVIVVSSLANEQTSNPVPLTAPDKQKVSYALGMNLGLQRKATDADIDIAAFTRGLSDVLQGNPTEVSETEIPELLNQARVKRLANQPDPAKGKVSYSLGMRMGGQLVRVAADVDAKVIAQGLQDVLDGKKTRIEQAEIEPLFEQSKAYGVFKQSVKNKTEGEAFLAKNAKETGVKTLSSGLQYQVAEAGSGQKPTEDDLIIVKYRGKFVNGKEFDHNDHFLTRINGGPQGWQEALHRMVVGSKWQVFLPSELAFGREGEPAHQVGPDSALIYDLEIVTIVHPGDPRIGSGSLGHGLDGELSTVEWTK